MRLLEIAMWWMITVLYCFVPSAIILYGSAILTHYILHGWGLEMDYNEACEAIVSQQEARDEIEAHSSSFRRFVLECGDKEEYRGSEVLDFLGY